ncbi:MAG TPA: hypothetical protein VKP60_02245, partial [Magnetospirillaceae bacterium]|nr:hypothetical protein [Magnetospirillaceae bacterium]
MARIKGITDVLRQNVNDLVALSSRVGAELQSTGEVLRLRSQDVTLASQRAIEDVQQVADMFGEKSAHLIHAGEQSGSRVRVIVEELRRQA